MDSTQNAQAQILHLTQDSKKKAALEQVTKILTETEGETTAAKCQEIFETLFGVSSVRDSLNSFFKKESGKIKDVLTEWVESRGLVDVLSIEHRKVHWCIAIRAAKIPVDIWEATSPEATVRMAGNAVGLQLNRPVHFMYADLRVFEGKSNSGKDTKNVAYIFAYKQNTGKYS